MAHAAFRRVVAVWDAQSGGVPLRVGPKPGPRRRRGDHRPIGLPERPTGLLRWLRTRLSLALDRSEEIAFLIFFLAFVAFAAQWLLLILG